MCSFASLSVACTVINDPAHPQRSELASQLVHFLEFGSIMLVLVISCLSLFVDGRVWMLVLRAEDDYKVQLIQARQGGLEEQLEALGDNLDAVKAKLAKDDADKQAQKDREAEPHDLEVKQVQKANDMEFSNPVHTEDVPDSGGDDDEDEAAETGL